MSIYTCSICNKSFNSTRALSGHMRMHGKSNGKTTQLKCCCLITKIEIMSYALEEYQKSLIQCEYCNKHFKPDITSSRFCSCSCRAKIINKTRSVKRYTKILPCRICATDTEVSSHANSVTCKSCKVKISTIQNQPTNIKKPKTIFIEIAGAYSKLFICTCKHCHKITLQRRKTKYCHNCIEIYSPAANQRYKFTFNLYDYPNLFDLDSLSKIGFYAPGGKSGKWNIKGLSRDHRVSVNESLKNNYDAFYITHPLNCQLMTHAENNKKKSKSSISYQELTKLIDEYELKHHAVIAGIEPA